MRTQSLLLKLLISVTVSGSVSLCGGENDADDYVVPVAGHSEHGEAYNEGPRQDAYLMGGTGKVRFTISTDNEQAQAFFDQGIGQLYGFWYYEAERSFRRVASLDPECAMAYWGMARANDENKDRAKAFIADAVERKGSATDQEKMYIDALDKYLNSEAAEKKVRTTYIKALEKIIRKYPDDIEAKAMLAVHLWQSSRNGVPMNSHQAVESLLGDVFRVEPMHSAHHFRIHLWDNEEPSQALASAAKCGQAAPTIAHMWHMPGHIYSRVKRYRDAVYQQEASARADHAHMMRDRVLPDQIHNYAHNNEWLIRNWIFLGQADEALSLAKNMLELPRHPKYNSFEKDGMCSCKYGRRRLIQTLETFELWDQVLELAETMYLEPTEQKEEQGKQLRLLGLAHYHHGDFSALKDCVDRLGVLKDRFDEDAEEQGDLAAEKKRNELDAKAAESQSEETESDESDDKNVANDADSADGDQTEDKDDDENQEGAKDDGDKDDGDKDDGVCIKKQPEDRDDAIEKARKDAVRKAKRGQKSVVKAIAELNGIQFLANGKSDEALEQFRESDIPKTRLARYYFLSGKHKKATELLQKEVDGGENEVPPLAAQVDILRRLDDDEAAKKAFDKLRSVAGHADLDIPILARLSRYASEIGFPQDWRQPLEAASDVGDRPSLDSLGPLRWTPATSTPWELVDHHESGVSLSDYRGRPVVVVFYLGAGCLHCVEQLHTFAPMLPEFEKAGIAMVGISTEDRNELAEAIQNFSEGGGFPIPLAADPKHKVFREYRVYDDFENVPLHGTFLIDGKGMIRWQDISYEPFLEPAFLLQESKRLLSLSDEP